MWGICGYWTIFPAAVFNHKTLACGISISMTTSRSSFTLPIYLPILIFYISTLQKNYSFLIELCQAVSKRTDEVKADLELHDKVAYVLDWYYRRLE